VASAVPYFSPVSSEISVREFQPSDAFSWDSFVESHPHGSPFHLTAWMRSIHETFRYEQRYLLAEEHGRIRGVLPLFLVRNLLVGKALISSPFAVYGGPLADSPQALATLRDAVRDLAGRLNVDYVELRNAYPEQCLGFAPIDRYVTFTQTISPDREAILESIPRKTRAAVRKSLKNPFTSRRVTDPTRFEDLYSRNLRRLGTPCFPKSHFLAILRNFAGKADIFEVVLNEKVVAAVLTFYFRDQVLPFYGASDPAFNAAAPNNYMYYEQMCQQGQEGFNLFDFGRSKKSNSGSFDFKAHWGMQERTLPYEILLGRRKELPNYSPNNPKFSFAIQLWQRVPMPIARAIGPRIIRLVP
jgi:FemAB-related protein (PEP-CTERM system-associated)